jgi:chromosome partitioning protein
MTTHWIITSRKGGVGKTTVAVGLASSAAHMQRTLLVDLDPQGDASTWLDVPDTGERLADALLGKSSLSNAIREGACGVDVAPAGEALSYVADRVSRDALRRALDSLTGPAYGAIVIDCPPSLSSLVVAGWHASPSVMGLVPIDGPSGWRAVARLRQAWQDAGLDPKRLRGVLTRYDHRRVIDRELARQIEERSPSWLLSTRMREGVVVPEAAASRRPLFLHAPRHRITDDMRRIAQEVYHGQA